MWFMPRLFFVLASLLFVTAVRAAPYGPSAHDEGVDSPPGKSANVKANKRSGSRYGIGYEARHGIDAGARSDRVERMERPEQIERIERPERIERDSRGR